MINNTDRILNAAQAPHAYHQMTKCDPEDMLGDLLTDLMHWAKIQNHDFTLALQRAEGYFEEERAV